MAGHSQFANIKHRKGAQDKKRANLFTKLIREIVVATKASGPDPDHNPRLRAAIIAARKNNVPKDRVDTAIKKASSAGDTENYEEMRYEGYGPGGVAFVVDALTDNRNRTASEIRTAFTKCGGALGETGSVSFMFDRVGLIHFERSKAEPDAMFEAALEAGADACESMDELHEIITSINDFNAVRDALVKKFGEPELARLAWKAKNAVSVDDVEKAESLIKLEDMLDESDDVQHISANYEVSKEIADKLAN